MNVACCPISPPLLSVASQCAIFWPSAPRRSPLARQQTRHHPNPDCRHRVPVPVPAVEDVEQQLWARLRPSLRAPRLWERRDPHEPPRGIRLRARRLTVPVRVARIVSLGWRRVAAGAEVQRVLAREGLWGVPPLQVSAHALPKRLAILPAGGRGALCAAVGTRRQAQPLPPWPGLADWAHGRAPFPRLAVRDGATLEALRKKTQALRGRQGLGLAGRRRVRVEAVSQRPLWHLYPADAAANDTRLAPPILAAVPAGGLGVCDLGFCSLLWFADCTAHQTGGVPRRRQQTASRTLKVLSPGP